MLRLDLQKEPRWLDLGLGVRIEVVPVSTHSMSAARRDPEFLAAAQAFRAVQGEGEGDGITALQDSETGDALGIALAKSLARRVIRNWEGVGDAYGKAVTVTPEGIDALLDMFPIFEAFQRLYLQPALTLDAEKNASALSPTGTSAGAKTIATAAKARGKAKGSASTARHG